MIYIITGGQGEGKTSFLKALTHQLRNSNVQLKGFLAAGAFEENLRSKFILEDVNTSTRELFCDTTPNPGDAQFGRFAFKPKGHEFGIQCLSGDEDMSNPIYVLDEIGKLETNGKGWHNAFKSLLEKKKEMIISVRNLYLYEVVSYFEIENFRIFNIADITPEQTAREIIESSGK